MTTELQSLPHGWRWVRLGDLSSDTEAFADGPFGSHLKTEHYSSSGARVIRLQNIGRGTFLDQDKTYVSLDHFANLGRHSVQAGDIMVAALGDGVRPAGRACILPEGIGPALAKADCFRVRLPRAAVHPTYLTSYLNSPEALARVAGTIRGATRPRLTLSMLRATWVPLPPAEEQQRIARKLGEQVVALERARAAGEDVAASISGLTGAVLRKMFSASSGATTPLGQILRLRKEIVHPHDRPKGSAIFVGLEHLESGTGRRRGSVKVNLEGLTGRKPRFVLGDIVYGYLRPYLNKVWVAEFDGLCSVDQYVYEVDGLKAMPEFVAWFMRSPNYLERAPVRTGPGQLPRIRLEEVAAVEVRLPSLDKQRDLVNAILDQIAAAEHARVAVEAQLESATHLGNALLRAAFNGKL